VEYLSDAYIALYMIRKKNVRERALEVIKMRGTNFVNKIVPFKITESGIQVYPDTPIW